MKRKIGTVLLVICFLLAVLIFVLTQWYTDKFDTSFAGLLFTLLTPMRGVGGGFWNDFLGVVLPPVLISLAVYLVLLYLLRSRRIGDLLA